jgi:hypothetical protein
MIKLLLAYLLLLTATNAVGQGFAPPSRKGSANRSVASPQAKNSTATGKKLKPVPKDVWGIDTFINPISVVTQLAHEEVVKARRRLDLMDGLADSSLHNYRGEEEDNQAWKLLYAASKKAQAYIENETFDPNPTLNLNIKKRYLASIAKEINGYCNNSYRQDFDFKANIFAVQRILELCNASKENRIESYLLSNVDETTFRLLNNFTNDEVTRLRYMNLVSVKLPHLLDHLPLLEMAKLDGFCNMVSTWARTSPNKVLIYSTSTGPERNVVRQCSNDTLQKIFELGDKAKNPLRAIAFVGPFLNGDINIAGINSNCATDDAYYSAIVALRVKNETAASNVIARDIAAMAKDYIRTVNELHDQSDNVRFRCVEKFSINELYYLCVMGSEDIYTSSYLGIYKRLMQKLGKASGAVLLQDLRYDKFRTFIRMCANYNTLDNFLASMPKAQSNDLIAKFVGGLGTTAQVDLEGAVDVADCVGSIQDTGVLGYMRGEVAKAYKAALLNNNRQAKNVYLILGSIFDTNDSYTSFVKDFKLPPINLVRNADLFFDTCKTIYEQMFFYGDEDGKVGYRSFLGTFDKTKWIVDQSHQYWTIVKSVNTKVPFVLYANKPLSEPDDELAQQKLNEYLTMNEIHPTIIVHRGHSYHLESTIEAMHNEHKIIILGSCGGYHNLQEILLRSPDAHIISTKQVGAFAINTPIINAVHTALASGADVQWDVMWPKLASGFSTNAKHKDLFNDYVPPHKNLGALFLKAYAKLEAEAAP